MGDIHAFEPLWGEWYALEPPIGSGSYGKVYKVEKRELGKCYYSAVKHIGIPSDSVQPESLYEEGLVTDNATLRDYYSQLLDSLMLEIGINYKLKGHTHIVSYEEHQVFPRQEEAGYDIFIKMELLTSLTEYIRTHPLTVGEVVRLGEEICTALMILRRERIVHRDIKPANIFINPSGDFKLGDFGIARTLEKSTSAMSIRGTFAYMAPEVARGEDGDYRIDTYSLGLVLYKLLNKNRGPFLPLPPERLKVSTNDAAQRRRMQGEPLPPPVMADPALAAILQKACAFRPADRWESAEAFRDALSTYRHSLPPQEAGRVVLAPMAERPAQTVAGTATEAVPPSRQTGPVTQEETEYVPPLVQQEAPPPQEETEYVPPLAHQETPPPQEETEYIPPLTQQEVPPPQEETEYIPPLTQQEVSPPQEETEYIPPLTQQEVPPPQEETEYIPPLAQQEAPAFQEETEYIVPPVQRETSPPHQTEALFTPPPPPPSPSQPAQLLAPPDESEAEPQTGPSIGTDTGEQYTPIPPEAPPPAQESSTLKKGSRLPVLVGCGVALVAVVLGVALWLNRGGDSTASQPTPSVSTAAPSAAPSVTPEAGAAWQDPTLEAAVRRVLNQPEGTLSPESLAGLTELRLTEEKGGTLTTLADLARLPGLKVLDLSGLTLTDPAGLEALTGLESLNLSGCGLTDAGFLSGLSSLVNLNLADNQLTDLRFITGLARLSYLNISGNQVADLTPVASLSALQTLDATGNPVTDWTPTAAVASVQGAPTPTATPSAQPTPKPSTASTARPQATTQPTARPQATPKPTPKPQPTPAPTPSRVEVSSVSLSNSSLLLGVGEVARLSASVSPSNATDRTVRWSSSNPGVAKVDGSGNVTAIASGTATITASCGGHSASCVVSVS